MDFYDSDLKSDNPDDFLSDHEPPSDIVRERKLLKKTDLFRIYKEIWQVNKSNNMRFENKKINDYLTNLIV